MGLTLYLQNKDFARACICGKIAAFVGKLILVTGLFVVKLLDLENRQVEILALIRRISCPESVVIL
jgi:hypothetical protein